jgi:hypothetical protein
VKPFAEDTIKQSESSYLVKIKVPLAGSLSSHNISTLKKREIHIKYINTIIIN